MASSGSSENWGLVAAAVGSYQGSAVQGAAVRPVCSGWSRPGWLGTQGSCVTFVGTVNILRISLCFGSQQLLVLVDYSHPASFVWSPG